MNDLQVISLENTDISNWDFALIKAELQKNLDAYAGIVYDDASIKDAKNDRSTLNKAKKIIEDARKAYKSRCLAPYEALEPQIKDLVSMIEGQRLLIDETVKDYENRQREEREQEVREYYDRKAVILGPMADILYSKLFDKKWVNATTGRARCEESILAAINDAYGDIETIRTWNSPFTETLLQVYAQTLSLETVESRNKELTSAAAAAGLKREEEVSAPVPAQPIPAKDTISVDKADGTILRLHATQYQLNQVCDFMKAIGVSYELL